MADTSRLFEALRNADAAGDEEAATRIAQMIRSAQAETQVAPTAEAPSEPSAVGGMLMRDYVEPANAIARLGIEGIGGAAVGGLRGIYEGITGGSAQEGLEKGMKATQDTLQGIYGKGSPRTQQLQETLGHALEKGIEKAGDYTAALSSIPGMPLNFIRQGLESAGVTDPEAMIRGSGEVGAQFIPIERAVTLGRRPSTHPPSVLKEAPATPSMYESLRKQYPELDQLSDRDITKRLLESEERKNAQVTRAEPGDLFAQTERYTPEELHAARREAAEGELASMAESDARMRELETGTKDMFRDTSLERPDSGLEPRRASPDVPPVEKAEVKAAAAEAKPEPGAGLELVPKDADPGIPYRNVVQEYLMEKAPDVIEAIQRSPTMGAAMERVRTAMDTLVRIRDAAMQRFTAAPYLRKGLQMSKEQMKQYEALHNQFKEATDAAVIRIQDEAAIMRRYAEQSRADTMNMNRFAEWLGREMPDQVRKDIDAAAKGEAPRTEAPGKAIEKTKTHIDFNSEPYWPKENGDIVKAQALSERNAAARASRNKSNFKRASEVEHAQSALDLDLAKGLTEQTPVSLREMLTRVMKESTDPFHRWGAKVIRTLMREDAEVRTGRLSNPAWAAEYGHKNGTPIVRFRSRGDFTVDTLLHEAFHHIAQDTIATWQNFIHNKKAQSVLNDRQLSVVKAIEGIEDLRIRLRTMFEARAINMADGRFYGLQDIHEFVSELFGNHHFRKMLQEQTMTKLEQFGTSPLARAKTAFDASLRFIARLFGFDSKVQTAWTESMRHTFAIMDRIAYQNEQGIIPMGDYHVTRGAVRDLRDALPPHFKHLAEDLAKELEKKNNPIAPESNNQRLTTLAKNNPGLAKLLKEMSPDVRPWAEAKLDLLKTNWDIPNHLLEKIGQYTVAGGKMYSAIKKHPVVKWGVDVINNARKNVEVDRYNSLFHEERGTLAQWKKLSDNEKVGLWEVIREHKGKKWLSEQELADLGMNHKQIHAYKIGEKNTRQFFAEMNAERIAGKQDPIKGVEGYWPSRWDGNYYIEIREKSPLDATGFEGQGKLLRVETANTERGLRALQEKFRRDGKYYVSEINERPRPSSEAKDFSMFDRIAESVSNTEEAKALLQTLDTYTRELADNRKFFRRHFETSSGVEGYKGSKYGADPKKEALNALHAMEGYISDGFDWIHTRRANREISAMRRDLAGERRLRNSREYLGTYWNHVHGVEGAIAKAINMTAESIPQALGLPRDSLRMAAGRMKKEAMLFMLGYMKPIFLYTQMVQPLQFMPSMLAKIDAATGGKSGSMTGAMWRGYNNAVSALISGHGDAALKYMIDNRLIEPHFLEDIRRVGSINESGLAKLLKGETFIQNTEKFARATAFYQTVEALKPLKLAQKEMFEIAADAVDLAMTNYRLHERSMMYKSFGIVGDTASSLMTFAHNYWSQMYMYGKEAVLDGIAGNNPRAVKPLLMMLSTQAVLSGMMGMPFREDLDRLIGLAKSAGLYPAKWPNVTQLILKGTAELPKKGVVSQDTGRFGLPSMHGIDMSTSLSAGRLMPEMSASGLFPVPAYGAQMVENLSPLIKKSLGMVWGEPGPNRQDLSQAALALPRSMGAPISERLAQGPADEKGMGIIGNPRKHMEGTVKRPTDLATPEWAARAAGTRTTEESSQRAAQHQVQEQEKGLNEAKQSLINKAIDKFNNGDEFAKELKEYIDLGGDHQTFINNIKNAKMNTYQTQEERTKQPKGLSGVQRYLLYKQLRGNQ